MQAGHDHFHTRDLFTRMLVYRHAPSVIGHTDRTIHVQCDLDF